MFIGCFISLTWRYFLWLESISIKQLMNVLTLWCFFLHRSCHLIVPTTGRGWSLLQMSAGKIELRPWSFLTALTAETRLQQSMSFEINPTLPFHLMSNRISVKLAGSTWPSCLCFGNIRSECTLRHFLFQVLIHHGIWKILHSLTLQTRLLV